MPTARTVLGRKAEDITAAYYEASGCTIINRNYNCRYGEIDIIVRDGDTLVFVEVRCRRLKAIVSPAESVDSRKIEKLIKTAKHYMSENNLPEDVNCRFDVAEVTFSRGRQLNIDIVKNAFIEE
jgi:putative endonuclease